MEKIINFLRSNLVIVIISSISLIFLSTSIYFYYKYSNTFCSCNNESVLVENKNLIHVDVKGYVKSPGVYEVEDKEIINNIIDLAGGFKKNAYTKNINLSKKVEDELVIYVYSKSEFNKINQKDAINKCSSNDYDISNCITNGSSVITYGEETPSKTTTDTKEVNTIVNINTATKEELMTITGIGESKALNIISYRETNGPFTSIEQIKEVNGIGDSLYEQIKNNITI